MSENRVFTQADYPAINETNKLIRNTYSLLSMTLVFSALMAGLSTALQVPYMLALVADIVAIGLLWFVLPRTANSATGIAVVFAITGAFGFGLGPTLNHYLSLSNGGSIIMTALGGTGAIFLGLSGYALVSKKDFSFLVGFIGVGMVVAVLAMLASLFLQMPALSLGISSMVVLLMSAFILFETSQLVRNPNTNYIEATAGLYLSILNLFVSLLHLLGFASND